MTEQIIQILERADPHSQWKIRTVIQLWPEIPEELCRRCDREFHTHTTGPDKGVIFVCGFMAECSTGCSGTYYKPKPCDPIIDADQEMLESIQREDRGDRVRADKAEEEP